MGGNVWTNILQTHRVRKNYYVDVMLDRVYSYKIILHTPGQKLTNCDFRWIAKVLCDVTKLPPLI